LHNLTRFGSRPGLERISRLLAVMGNPQRHLQCVHIAGTNGKGSTSLIIAGVLSQAGYRVGRFISPHLHSYLERITIDGAEIKAGRLEVILDEIESHIQAMLQGGEEHPTEFEVLTAAAFRFFAQERVEIAVLEVGMGGTYDSTNVVIPRVAVITGIDFDHTAFLGDTLTEIAANKAGIIKAGVPVVAGPMSAEARQVISTRAQQLGAPLFDSSDMRIVPSGPASFEGQVVDLKGPGINETGLTFSLPGTFQLSNLAVALQSLQVLKDQGLRIDAQHIRDGLANLRIPGRLEAVHQQPLVVVDAAHNPQGARALAESLGTLLPGRLRVLVLGLLDDKERTGVIEALAPGTRAVVVTRPQGARSQAWQEVAQAWRQKFPAVQVELEEDIARAAERSLGLVREGEYILITGSFYVIDQARKVFVK